MNNHIRTVVELLMLFGAAVGFVAAANARDTNAARAFAAGFVFLAALLLLRLARARRAKPLSRHARIAIVGTVLWVIGLQLWGFIWGWHRYFDGVQFLVLHLAAPALAWVAWHGYRWVTSSHNSSD